MKGGHMIPIEPIITAIIIVGILLILMSGYVKAPPDKAYIISGFRKKPKLFESMKETTGIDLGEIMKAGTYDAKVNRNVHVTGLENCGAGQAKTSEKMTDYDHAPEKQETAGSENGSVSENGTAAKEQGK